MLDFIRESVATKGPVWVLFKLGAYGNFRTGGLIIGYNDSSQKFSVWLITGKSLMVSYNDRETLVWDVGAIRSRQAHLIAFARAIWNPTRWH